MTNPAWSETERRDGSPEADGMCEHAEISFEDPRIFRQLKNKGLPKLRDGVKERTASFTKKYRYAWNGKESENELFEGCLAFEARIYDSRIARWMSTDPREAEYAWQSTYVYFSNSPISVIDFLGMGATTENEPASTDDAPTRSDNTPLCSLPIFELATESCSQKNINSDLYWNNPNVDDPTAMQKAWKIDPLITYQSIQV